MAGNCPFPATRLLHFHPRDTYFISTSEPTDEGWFIRRLVARKMTHTDYAETGVPLHYLSILKRGPLMKKFLVFMLLLVIVFIPASAKKCSYEINKVDEFSGKATKSTSATIAKSWKMFFSKNDNTYAISVYLLLPGEINAPINKGDSLFVKLNSGEIIRLVGENDVPPRSYVMGSGAYAGIVTDFTSTYQCTLQDLEKIGVSGVSIVRIFIAQQFMEVPVKKKDGEKMAEAATCVLE